MYADISNDNAMRQAPMTVDTYLREVVEDIDNQFGEGFAEKNPGLVGSMIESCTRDYYATTFLSALQKIAGAIESIRTDHPLQGETLDGVSDGLQKIASAIRVQ